MQEVDTNIPANRRQPVRMDGQDGPWAVSVAESPHDSRSYSLYIKTPTHNLTLTRTAVEIVELDRKLRDSHPSSKIPAVPIDPSSVPKRKSNFLNTLSRLASPTSNKTAKSRPPLPTPPLTTPGSEVNDPFTAIENPSIPSANAASTATSTAIAAYLTSISNVAELKKDRVWKRFVRVRTDDLESVRVERAIKRVRSDLAAHVGGMKRDSTLAEAEKEEEESLPTPEDEERKDVQDETVAPPATQEADPAHDREATATPADVKVQGNDGQATETLQDEAGATGTDASTEASQDQPNSLPESPSVAQRLLRSQSCEPDKSHRLSRNYASSVALSQDGGMSSQVEETGDESSFSATDAPRRRKKKHTGPRERKSKKVTIDDFEMIRVLGKGCAGKVLLVRHKSGTGLYALKAITKRHVLAHQELQHTLTEQAVLKRMAAESKDPFVVKLWWSFHDKENLFLVMDFHPGGDLATQLARWGRLSRDRTRCEGLHAAGVIYRDLKPENILIAADGHIVLTDFGLSKEFARPLHNAPLTPSGSRSSDFYSSAPGTPASVMPPWMKADKNGEMMYGWPGQPIGTPSPDLTTTFCGTAEYLAPEVIQGLPYGYEVDWWSFGTMLFEMLTGMTPFYAANHSDMYVRVLQDELVFPDDRVMDQDTKSLIRGLLQKNPDLRIREPRIKKHPYFSMIDWCHVYYKRYIPPYVPPVDRTVAYDTQNFDETFLDMEPVLDEYVDESGQATDTDAEPQTDTDRTDGEGDEAATTPSQSRSSSVRPSSRAQAEEYDDSVDVFDGYSFKGRHSIIMDDEDEEEEGGEDSEEGEEEYDENASVGVEEDGRSSVTGTTAESKSETATIDEEVSPEGQVDDLELEPKTPEARPPAPLPPVEEPIVQPAPAPKSPKPEPAKELETPVVEEAPKLEKPKPQLLEVIVPKDVPTKSEEDLFANASAAVELQSQLESQATEDAKRLTIIAEDKAASGSGFKRHSVRGKRREKSGVAALDKYLSDAGDDEHGTELERDEEDEDWDFVEAGDGEDKNGAKGTSLWARGVVDRYKLSVFRKGSTPGTGSRTPGRSFTSLSKSSSQQLEDGVAPGDSPSQRRGRTSGLNFRKSPRQFLRPKSPPSSFTNNSTTRSFSATANSLKGGAAPPTASGASSIAGILTPSLRSKPSAVSMDARSLSSDYSSGNPFSPTAGAIPSATNGGPESPEEQGEKDKEKDKKTAKKLKMKYKNNAEKVFSLFSSNSGSPKPSPAGSAKASP
ncbi:AGC/AGC-unique protein kinase [Coprinopsis sp. MPI-PUGE-AT-0042]|nr:AGC/AGC-unique protein kinase [Coprinopsis sp. MPI-PUGE-AT-0042]